MPTTERLLRALALIDQYNAEVESDDRIDKDQFQKKLKKIGGTTEELLAELKWEDLQVCGLPTLLARKVATIFRSPTVESSDSKHVSEKTANRMPPLYLIQSYDPSDPTTPVAKRLREISFGKKFLVFNLDGTINAEHSLKLLNELRKGYEARDSVDFDNRIGVPVFAVGESTGEFVEENPLYAGRPLRPDGTCDQLNRSWEGVPAIVRQLLHFAVNEAHELNTFDIQRAHDLLDIALQADAEKKIRTRFRKASALWDEKSAAGQLPTLRVKIGKVVTRSNNPFFKNRVF